MAQAKSGDTVEVNYIGSLTDGTVFDQTGDDPPLKFKLGDAQVIPGFEAAVAGMSVGEKKTVTLSPAESYGDVHDDLVLDVERSRFPDGFEAVIGSSVQGTSEDGSVSHFVVTAADEQTISLDGNHPLAGRELVFDLELVAVSDQQE
ncbi:MAG: FKBP-type peptidyl-prolyl cis-trans isomerase [Candidatus Marinimicrobia bacterium]|nr:FKBP-type peptidyl-prolyl cis-trans isomerase [Candidatus Neomarinimicrobiota bacterium]